LPQHLSYGAKVGLKGAKSLSEWRQSLPGVRQRGRVEIQSNYASVAGGLKNCFAVSAKPNRAIYKETASLRSEEFDRLFQQHGAMGRAYAPQRRSHLHRPVISFKELLSFVL